MAIAEGSAVCAIADQQWQYKSAPDTILNLCKLDAFALGFLVEDFAF
ncbi:MAG: hypothetical protein KME57_02815 [Scytonema hyalinum WJT4-NPBG1]|jgi:hypothetical protein|nr:hypothetical protein [Scytonema hyalinum WJT4-NPBG1]